MAVRKKKCRTCQRNLSTKRFRKRSNRPGLRCDCNRCHNNRTHARRVKDVQENRGVERLILRNAKRSDRRFGRFNDLTIEYIREEISKGCSYCEAKDIRMTLDRVDNSIGHTIGNVVPSCVRCNLIRGQMPHRAWTFLIEGIRKARLDGAFGNWFGPMHMHGVT